MSPIFIKAKAMTMDLHGKWMVDHYCRINMNHVTSFRVVDAESKDEMIMEVYFSGRAIATILAIETDDIKGWVRT